MGSQRVEHNLATEQQQGTPLGSLPRERRRKGQQRMKWLDDITDLMDMGLGRLWQLVTDREAWRAAIHGVIKIGHN